MLPLIQELPNGGRYFFNFPNSRETKKNKNRLLPSNAVIWYGTVFLTTQEAKKLEACQEPPLDYRIGRKMKAADHDITTPPASSLVMALQINREVCSNLLAVGEIGVKSPSDGQF